MANKRFWLGMLVMVLAFGMTAVGCDNGSPPASPKTFTVTFDTGDGSGTPPPVQTVEDGKSIFMPGRGNMTAPAGKEFDGWRGDGRNLAIGDTYTVTKDVMFIAQWKDSGSNPGGNEIDGVNVLGTQNGLTIILDPLKIPAGTHGIQYYISRPDYKKPVQIWFEVSQVPQTLLYPYTESGYEYTVKTQYTKVTGDEPFAKDVKATAQGGIGEIFLRNDSTVRYVTSSRNVDIYPQPDFVYPNQGQRHIGLILYTEDYTAVYFVPVTNMNATEFPMSLFTDPSAQQWASRPLSYYYDRRCFIELGYYFTYNNREYKVVIGNTDTFTFPYLN
jgi:hypothetical protein